MNRTVITKKDIKAIKNFDRNLINIGSNIKLFKRAGLANINIEPGITAAQLDELEKQMPTREDTYLSRLLKYIPTEIIVLYLTLRPVLSQSNDERNLTIHWFVFSFGLVMTPIYLWRLQNVHKKSQLLVSTLSFFVWVFAIGGPFAQLEWYKSYPLYAAIVVPLFTFLIPLFEAQR